MKKARNLLTPLKDKKGQALIMFATMVAVLLALGALSIDVGHVFVVRNQLQNAADAAVLSGAGYLYPSASGGGPNWSLASSKATSAITLNQVDGIALTNGTVTTGYWNSTGSNSTLSPTTSTPTNNDAPAVKVTISKSSGNNGGPIKLFLGPIFWNPNSQCQRLGSGSHRFATHGRSQYSFSRRHGTERLRCVLG
ncbi:TadE/TadG family type IV pilus assembly protein [Candidatus Protochlamydia phocaeensis]|uniref:TadE/TadG family type IV pilus assembly protein n=1 Tax=Candidatus Protochlamydia phocaeensis TaxID=1414722 RepID=UPI0008383545|nr:TadE/TadG family type IV pilus assembly protein [Candidatus Protochlamydia phocaeensis]